MSMGKREAIRTTYRKDYASFNREPLVVEPLTFKDVLLVHQRLKHAGRSFPSNTYWNPMTFNISSRSLCKGLPHLRRTEVEETKDDHQEKHAEPIIQRGHCL